MTRDDIIRMATEAKLGVPGVCADFIFFQPGADGLVRFAALIEQRAAAAEREACAKVCDGWLHANGDDCAAVIRARGEP